MLAMRWLQHTEIFDTSAEFFTDALMNYGTFFNEADIKALFAILTGTWGVSKFQEILSGRDEIDPSQFIRLVIAFAEANVKRLAMRPGDIEVQMLMQMMHRMLTVPGYPVVEDEISPQTFEFWSSYVEYLLDRELSVEPDNKNHAEAVAEEGRRHVFQAISDYWAKIKIPPAAIAETWSRDSKEGFISFRKDYADLLETSYPLLHAPLFIKFVNHVLSALPGHDWEVSRLKYSISILLVTQ